MMEAVSLIVYRSDSDLVAGLRGGWCYTMAQDPGAPAKQQQSGRWPMRMEVPGLNHRSRLKTSSLRSAQSYGIMNP